MTTDFSNNKKAVTIEPNMPHFMMTFDYHQRPTALTGVDPRFAVPSVCTSLQGLKPDNGEWMTIPGPVNCAWYFQFLAKIAHAFAVASFGVESFRPYLLELLADPEAALSAHFIGMLPDKPEREDGALHRLRTEVLDQVTYRLPLLPGGRRRLAVVYIDIFMNHWHHHTYEVVVGEMN